MNPPAASWALPEMVEGELWSELLEEESVRTSSSNDDYTYID